MSNRELSKMNFFVMFVLHKNEQAVLVESEAVRSQSKKLQLQSLN